MLYNFLETLIFRLNTTKETKNMFIFSSCEYTYIFYDPTKSSNNRQSGDTFA